MIEIIINKYLGDALQLPVYGEYPENPPERFVILKRTGEGREDHLESALIIAHSYAESLYEAASLNEQTKSALDGLDQLDEISSVQLAADYPAYDTDNKRHCFQAVYEIHHY